MTILLTQSRSMMETDGYEAQILQDSLSPDGIRLTTIQVTYPHAVHKDIMTHRAFSRNFQSFRALPPETVIAKIRERPFIPDAFAKRVKGMEQGATVEGDVQNIIRDKWLHHIMQAVDLAEFCLGHDLAKQQINFLLQDFSWITGIITATEWDNFWALRADAPEGAKPRPEVEKIAQMMQTVYEANEPYHMDYGEWHLPLVTPEDYDAFGAAHTDYGTYVGDWDALKKISVGRCARVSYLTHDGKRDHAKDIELHDQLLGNGHMSPFEHAATPIQFGRGSSSSGNFYGWHQYRKEIINEGDFGKVVASR